MRSIPMILMKTHDHIPLKKVGDFVQQCLDEKAVILVVTRNADGKTCTVCVQKE